MIGLVNYEECRLVMGNVNLAPTIVVDIDGTLVNSDLLVERLFLYIRLSPLRLFWQVLHLRLRQIRLGRSYGFATLPH